jgi:hypothetical protein
MVLAAPVMGKADVRLRSAQEVDQRTNAVAQLLAGIRPADGSFSSRVETAAWQQHRDVIQGLWQQVRESRVQEMIAWRERELRPHVGGASTLLYPFSGPDFLNAYLLFPGLDTYVMFGLEMPGALPDISGMSDVRFGELLGDVRAAMRDIFERNYFITQYMSKDLHTPRLRGTVPVMLVMQALLGHRIVSADAVDPWPERTQAHAADVTKRPRKSLRAARVLFIDPRVGKAQTLVYYSLDATDKALAHYPEFLPMLANHRGAVGLVKSASYLMHDGQFRGVRDTLLDTVSLLVQDDTGIPYRFLTERGWDVRLYGQYSRPIKHFNYGHQPDLDAAFRATRVASELPFSFGYHWKEGKSGLMVARRIRG